MINVNKYDYIVVGAGIYGATFARLKANAGYKVLVIDKRNIIGGNCSDKVEDDILVHLHGPHIFHTSNKEVWNFVNEFSDFYHFRNQPIARYKTNSVDKVFNLPFNMNTFCKMFDVATIEQAKAKIQSQIDHVAIKTPKNLEEQAISMVGTTIYYLLVKDYTEKQWGKSCKELSPDIIKRLPLRFTFNNDYFNDEYQGIPIDGYSAMITKMLVHKNISIELGIDAKEVLKDYSGKIVYCGRIDEYFDFCLGRLSYRSLRFEEEKLDINDYQGNAVVNYTSSEQKYTRIAEYKHFMKSCPNTTSTIIVKEFPLTFQEGLEPYYCMNDEVNLQLYNSYLQLVPNNMLFGGRLGKYKYFDMDDAILEAMKDSEKF